jgi:hypothetical protein
MEEVKKFYSAEEIRKLALGYKGKPQIFDPAKAGKKNVPRSKPHEPQLRTPAPPTMPADQKPTAQCNDPIISKAIFGNNVTVMEIALRHLSRHVVPTARTLCGVNPEHSILKERTALIHN